MAKLSRLIRLINLLSGPKAVPLEKICAVCEVAPRTAYRYLTDISEGAVPVYFDREQGGYRLLLPQHIKLDHLTLSESVLLTCALSFMCRHVNAQYRQDYIDLIEKIQSTDSALVGEILANLDDIRSAHSAPPDYSDRLTTSLIELAIANHWSLRIDGPSPENERHPVEFRRPRLCYHQGWVIEDEGTSPVEAQELNRIRRVEIL